MSLRRASIDSTDFLTNLFRDGPLPKRRRGVSWRRAYRVDDGRRLAGRAENFPGCKALKTHKTGKESRRSGTATLPPPRMDKEGERQRRAQPWLRDRAPLL